jgi:hypothetical protein
VARRRGGRGERRVAVPRPHSHTRTSEPWSPGSAAQGRPCSTVQALPGSHDSALVDILETYRVTTCSRSRTASLDVAIGILQLGERRRVRVRAAGHVRPLLLVPRLPAA